MEPILSVTFPFFALIGLGYLAARKRWVPPESIPAFNGFLLYFAVPAMLFRFASATPFSEITNLRYFAAWALAGASVVGSVAFVMRRFLAQSSRDAAFYGLSAGVANAGFMGVPLLVALLGERAAGPVILAIVADLVVVSSVGLAMAHAVAPSRILVNPLLVAMLLGAAFSGLQLGLPVPIAEIVKLLGLAAGPCALFAIGLSLVRPDAPLRSPLLAVPVAAKLLLHPLIVGIAMWAFAIDAFTTKVAVLTAALPSAGWVFIFAVRYKADAGRISATILLTTALAFVSLSLLLFFLVP
jgi:predicted permease